LPVRRGWGIALQPSEECRMTEKTGLSYAEAGVDIAAGNALV